MQISYSEYRIWKADKDDWYKQYVLGIKPKPSPEMILGTILHDGALMGGDYLAALTANHFTSDFHRTAKAIVSWAGWAKIPQREQKLSTDRVQAKLDGVCTKSHHIWELKTGKTHWTQQRADESEQVTIYCLVYYRLYGVMPKATVITANVGNGKIKELETVRTGADLARMEHELAQMVEYIEERGWWDQRKKYKH